MSARMASPTVPGRSRAWRIVGERTEDDGTVVWLDAVSFGHSPEQAVHRYVTLLQPHRVPFADGTLPATWEEHELRAEAIE